MKQDIKCPLCNMQASYFLQFREKEYYTCSECSAIMMNPQDYLSADEERDRYLTHNNDVNDIGYQKFVTPIVNAVINQFSTNSVGLDFGAGTGPVVSKMLRDKGYNIEIYDPFFHDKKELLNQTYDYIVSCEVVEHFYNPLKEFTLLKSLLKENGTLFIKTNLYEDGIEFNKWYYKNDPTHVFFYHPNTFKWIENYFKFSKLTISNRLVTINN